MAAADNNKGYIAIDLIEVALCPLSFEPMTLAEHLIYRQKSDKVRLIKRDKSLEHLVVGTPIDAIKFFKYWDENRHQAVGTYFIKAPYGMAPSDFRIVMGLYNYLRSLYKAGELPDDPTMAFDLPEIARICRQPYGGGKQNLRLRSSLFRLGFFTSHSTAEWDPEDREFAHRMLKFFTVKKLSRLGKPKKAEGAKKYNTEKVILQFDPSLIDLVKSNRVIPYDIPFLDTLNDKHQRHYLQSIRYGWNQKASPKNIEADQYACDQIWFADHDEQKRRRDQTVPSEEDRTHQRRGWLETLLREATDKYEYNRPTHKDGWQGKFLKTSRQGKDKGKVYVRWANGRRIKNKRSQDSVAPLKADNLYQVVSKFRDSEGQPPSPKTFHLWIERYGRNCIAKQADVIRWMKDEKKPFKKSEVQALVDRMKHPERPLPSGFQSPTQQTLFEIDNPTRDERLTKQYQKIMKTL